MPDREKVIKGLHQHCECSLFDRCGECPYYEFSDEQFSCRDRLLEDALTLLKEQETVVQCKDCKHGIGDENAFVCGLKQLTAGMDWFCADGEVKE